MTKKKKSKHWVINLIVWGSFYAWLSNNWYWELKYWREKTLYLGFLAIDAR